MNRDRYAEKFSEVLFNYLFYADDLISASEIITAVSRTEEHLFEFVSEAAKAVVVLSVLTVPSFDKSMDDYFKKYGIKRKSIFAFLTKHCFDYHANTRDIFAVILITCAFVYRLFVFCHRMGSGEFMQFAAMCWAEVFEYDFKVEFHARGGWNEFKEYVAEKRYVSMDDDSDPKAVEDFMEEIGYLFPKLGLDPQQSCMSPETMANLETSCAEGVDEPRQNKGAAGLSFGTVDLIASSIPGFLEKSKAVVFQYDNPNAKVVRLPKKTNLKQKPFNKSSLPTMNPVIDTTKIEGQTCPSVQGSEVDQYSTERNSKSKGVVHKVTTAVGSSAIQEDPKDEMFPANITELLDSVPEAFRNIGSCFLSSVFGKVPQKGVQTKNNQVICKGILSQKATVDPNADKMLSDKICVNGVHYDKFINLPIRDAKSDGEGGPGAVSRISGRSTQDRYPMKDDSASCRDFSGRPAAESPNSDNTMLLSDKICINGVYYDKFVNLPIKDTKSDCNGEDGPSTVSRISGRSTKERNPIKDDQAICRDFSGRQAAESRIADNTRFSDKICVSGVYYDKFVNLPVNDAGSDFVSGISNRPQVRKQIKDNQTIYRDISNYQARPISDFMELLSEKIYVNGVCFDKYVYLTEKNYSATINNGEDETDTESGEETLV